MPAPKSRLMEQRRRRVADPDETWDKDELEDMLRGNSIVHQPSWSVNWETWNTRAGANKFNLQKSTRKKSRSLGDIKWIGQLLRRPSADEGSSSKSGSKEASKETSVECSREPSPPLVKMRDRAKTFSETASKEIMTKLQPPEKKRDSRPKLARASSQRTEAPPSQAAASEGGAAKTLHPETGNQLRVTGQRAQTFSFKDATKTPRAAKKPERQQSKSEQRDLDKKRPSVPQIKIMVNQPSTEEERDLERFVKAISWQETRAETKFHEQRTRKCAVAQQPNDVNTAELLRRGSSQF